MVDKLSKQKMKPITLKQDEALAQKYGAVKYLKCSVCILKKMKNIFYETIVTALKLTSTIFRFSFTSKIIKK